MPAKPRWLKTKVAKIRGRQSGQGIASKRVNKTTMTVVSQVRWTGGRKSPTNGQKRTWRRVTINHHKKDGQGEDQFPNGVLMAWWINNTVRAPSQ